MSSQESYLDALKQVVDEVVAPGAASVDADGVFPRAQLDALGAAGILALTVPAEFGGGGAGLREAAVVVRELGSVCGSTAMVVAMHYSAVAGMVAAGDKDTLVAIAGGRTCPRWRSPRPGRGLTSGRRCPPRCLRQAGQPPDSMRPRAGSPQPGTPTATSGRADR